MKKKSLAPHYLITKLLFNICVNILFDYSGPEPFISRKVTRLDAELFHTKLFTTYSGILECPAVPGYRYYQALMQSLVWGLRLGLRRLSAPISMLLANLCLY